MTPPKRVREGPRPRDRTRLRVPTEADLSRLYWELAQRGASAVGTRKPWAYRPANDEELVCLAAEMARHDGRALGLTVELIVRTWRELHPYLLRQAMQQMNTPQTLCVVLDFAREADPDRELAHFVRYVTADWPKVAPVVHFFVDDVRPGERTNAHRVGRSLVAYARWGFIGVERPTVDVFQKRTVGRYDAATRTRIARALAQRSPDGVGIVAYLAAVDGSISRQQAAADLRASGLRPSRRGPGAMWSASPRRVSSANAARR